MREILTDDQPGTIGSHKQQAIALANIDLDLYATMI